MKYLEIKIRNVTTFINVDNITLIEKELCNPIENIFPIKCVINLKYGNKVMEFYLLKDNLDLSKIESTHLKIIAFDNLQELIESYKKSKEIQENGITFSLDDFI
ncbi:hypothetical protein DCO58_11785 [Helicobacter saguini]|uniref:Uncharacterized protein n=1 Tax=Helicobacter saguini TaxID=1548018 RepID=A0A347VQ93_9HELI|nr:hypothetical protein [Helicobacter saguini]MWV61030.1 hypothetical protein [Helicobacter saguini]MWV68301.1 hypothetical protein [Helicobacter saguini]MWV70234.1 hypothetical protein [Helicobacter saguini]MWV72137.1 hypothetical protein [Helicobacter saguini]TLD91638.1 hypothetical protein LS64_011650 [Helicobacter saguini]